MGVYRTCLCSTIKGYPAIFGILLIWEKRWKEAIRLMIYGLLFCFWPAFALIGTGFKYNITQWLVNLGENGEKIYVLHITRVLAICSSSLR